MINLNEIRSLTEFQRNAREFAQQLKETGRPQVLTVNGRAELVVQSAESYQGLMDRLERLEAIAAVRAGLDEVRAGETRPAREALEELRRKHALSR